MHPCMSGDLYFPALCVLYFWLSNSKLWHAAASYSILKRWNVDMKLGWRLASGFFDRVAQRSSAPVITIDMFAHALLWNFNASSLKSVIALSSHILYYYRYYEYRMLRPQVRQQQCSKFRMPLNTEEYLPKVLGKWGQVSRKLGSKLANIILSTCSFVCMAGRQSIRLE